MFIDTLSRVRMEKSTADLLMLDTAELYRYISAASDAAQKDGCSFNTQVFGREMNEYFSNMISSALPDEILLFHLTRRLDCVPDYTGHNLHDLLLTDNPLNAFLKEHFVTFEPVDNRMELFFRGKHMSLERTTEVEVCYLRNRLGYNIGHEDYCFNGFAFRDQLMKNQYARSLYSGPEFLEVLSRFLHNNSLLDDYEKRSTYYCLQYKLPISQVIFDGYDNMSISEKQEHLLNQVAYRLLQYMNSERYFNDSSNPILRLKDDDTLPPNYFVKFEEITLDMIN